MKKLITKKQTTISKSNYLEKTDSKAVGIDVGADSLFVCAGLANGSILIREFPTFTSDLLEMAAWLKGLGSGSIAMESTGVYWIPSYDILKQAGFDVKLVDARLLNAVPGRNKTDVHDCQWIQKLHSYGLLNGAFRPDDQGVELRGYVRQYSLIKEYAGTQLQLMHKALTQMNIQLRQELSSISGITGMQIIRAIVDGERDAKVLAEYRDHRCKGTKEEFIKALTANYRNELVFALTQALNTYDFLQKQLVECERMITPILENWKTENHVPSQVVDPRLDSPQTAANLKRIFGVDLTKIPGLGIIAVVKIFGEIGTNINAFLTSKHFAAWMGVSPSNKISGGKVLNSKTKATANRVKQVLRMSANTLYRSKSALGGFLRRMKIRIGAPAAITAAAHKMAEIIWTMLTKKKEFKEAGEDAYQRQYEERVVASLKKKAAAMGYSMTKNEPQVA